MAIVPQLLAALDALDYPKAKLDVKLVLEAGDAATLAAVSRAAPAWADIVVVPAGGPQTKPRALNAALPSARGDLLVIYDAEDVPDPRQLRAAAARFAAEPDLDCVQGRLAIHNFAEGWLPRCFALEYAVLFDLFVPGLAALGLPFGLGGTSNHFRLRALREVGAWDAWNVAEDADLGVRLARSGRRIGSLALDTLEEAPVDLGNWFRQRVRWQKGWMQTVITHSRHPLRLARELGPARTTALFALTVGGTLGAMVWPALTLTLIAHALTPIPDDGAGLRIFEDVVTYLISIVGAQSIVMPMLAVIKLRGLQKCRATLLTLPAYYLLICAASWVAAYELARRPFHWSKTEHRAHSLADFAAIGARRA